jgi:hypothetical protein
MIGKIFSVIVGVMVFVWLVVGDGGPEEKKQATNLDDVRVMKSVEGQLVVSNKGKATSDEDYEMDLTERCKDWLYFRNSAYRLGKEGDTKGAATASRKMQAFMRDLEERFSEQAITEEIERLEKEGFKLGF